MDKIETFIELIRKKNRRIVLEGNSWFLDKETVDINNAIIKWAAPIFYIAIGGISLFNGCTANMAKIVSNGLIVFSVLMFLTGCAIFVLNFIDRSKKQGRKRK
jgi:hypothetical protein